MTNRNAATNGDDPRPLPPLGYCAECIRAGTWLRAATHWQGTAYCATHLVHIAGIDESDDGIQAAAERENRQPATVVLRRLRSEMREPVGTSMDF